MIRFTKYEGIGNDYLFIDCLKREIADPPELSRRMADRHFGVGSDGIIMVTPPEPGTEAHLRMRIFNADGSEAEMCGNGIRGVCKFAHDRGLCREHPMRIQTGAGVLELTYRAIGPGAVEMVTVDMGEPVLAAEMIPARVEGHPRGEPLIDSPLETVLRGAASRPWFLQGGLDPRMTCVSMGNPHAMVYCRNVDEIDLAAMGRDLEQTPAFPNRINLHIVQVRSAGEVTMRTWERGSGLTLACGTGAAAVCVAGVLTGRGDRRILAHLPGGDLTLHWDETTRHVMMTGPSREVFSGEWPE